MCLVYRVPASSENDAASLEFIKEELALSDREIFICLHLTIKHTVISYEVVSTGSINAAVIHPREVFKGAILANAAAVILYHNHPSGDPDPSAEDIAVTNRVKEAGKTLGMSSTPFLNKLSLSWGIAN